MDTYINRALPKEHIGYIVDRTGFNEFKKFALDGVDLEEVAIERNMVNWNGIIYSGAENDIGK